MNEPDLITVPEAARILRISRSQAYDLAQQGKLPGLFRIGGSLRVNKPKLVAYIERHSIEVPA